MIHEQDSCDSLLPADSWDCHMHVFGDETKYPFARRRSYTPPKASIEQWQEMAKQIGLRRFVLIQPSVYQTDNSCMLDVMRLVGPASRGVVVIDEEAISDSELNGMHELGVRGVRINVHSAGVHNINTIASKMQKTASRIHRLGWHIQLFTDLQMIERLAESIDRSPVPIVVDHFGLPKAELGLEQPGFSALCDLLGRGNCWVKISAPYRISVRSDYADVGQFISRLVEAAPQRIIWASDWPHTGEHSGHVDGEAPLVPFRNIDIGQVARLVTRVVPESVLQQIFVENPLRLYD